MMNRISTELHNFVSRAAREKKEIKNAQADLHNPYIIKGEGTTGFEVFLPV